MFYYNEQNTYKWFKGAFLTDVSYNNLKETVKQYSKKGYDFLVFLNEWKYFKGVSFDNLTVLSGCKYTFSDGVRFASILSVGAKKEPQLNKNDALNAQEIVNQINCAGGLSVFSAPMRFLASANDIASLKGLFGVEIYSPIYDNGPFSRAYNGGLIDTALKQNKALFLTPGLCLKDSENEVFIMLRAKGKSEAELVSALKDGNFYVSSGPEIIDVSVKGNDIFTECSPAVEAVFLSSSVWAPKRMKTGENETDFHYTYQSFEEYIRIEITDKNGKTAYTQPFFLKAVEKNV